MLSKRERLELREMGADFVGDWLADGGDPDAFDGQSEAIDMASGVSDDDDDDSRSAVADEIYEGMVGALRAHRSSKRDTVRS